MFFEMAGLSGSAIDHTAHPFRRLFGIIYYYRYSNRLLQALQRHYRHKDFFTPFTYIFDPKKREQARSIEEQWKFSKEQEVLEQGLQEVGEEVFRQVVQEILEGKPHGGGFPKEVRRFYARLAENAEFNAMDLSEQAGTISVRLLKRGHFPMVFPYGGCTAGSCDSIDRGNCYSAADDELHREMASIETCHGCRFHLTNEDYLSNLDFQLGRLRAEADDPDRSLAEQRASQRVADNLAEMIDLERRMAIRQAERMKDVLSKGYKTDAKEE